MSDRALCFQRVNSTLILLACMLTSSPAEVQGQSPKEELVRGIIEYLHENHKEKLIISNSGKFDPESIGEVVDFVLSCKGAVPTTPSSLLPCVARIIVGDDAKGNEKERQDRLRRLEQIKGDCVIFLEKAVPIWKKQAVEAAEAYEKFIATVFRAMERRKIARSEEIFKQEGRYLVMVEDHKKHKMALEKAFESENAELIKSIERDEANITYKLHEFKKKEAKLNGMVGENDVAQAAFFAREAVIDQQLLGSSPHLRHMIGQALEKNSAPFPTSPIRRNNCRR